jgi:medium-chain acyl-[acyl-carrier-protein] hydrolase
MSGTPPIFCVPYAGGSARVYESWRKAAGPHEAVRPLDLPGRGVLTGTAARSVPEAAALVGSSMAEAVRDGSPYVLFGHSLGALVAFEMAAARHTIGLPRPALVVVSGRNAPATPPEWARRASVLTDAELFTELRMHGGIPSGLSRSIAAQFFLPRLRADLRMAAGYRADPARHRIDAPLLVVHGREDPLVHPRAAAAWAEFTDERCTVHTHSGGHFAIYRQLPEVVALINSALLGADAANAAEGV